MSENHLYSAELSEEENCNQLDGIINNTRPKPSILEALQKQRREEAERRGETTQAQTRKISEER